ncbi:MAG: hypothetical protein KF729_09115 [Sandaracinaceae bacterium]|nr:hypothetical protein [Sandaracinaceae bacterium]
MTRRLPIALALLFAATPARADEAADLSREAAAAERRGEPAVAVERYRALVAADPTSRLAGRARRRLEWLEARAEGDYRPLSRYLALRERPPAERTRERLAAFEAEVRSFPEGRVARESWALLGEAWLALDEPARAEAAFLAWLDRPDLESSERVSAQTGLARARAARAGPAAGAELLRAAGLEATSTHATLTREARRGPLRVAAASFLALFLGAVLFVGRRALLTRDVLARAFSLGRLAAAAHVLVVPWALASHYDHDVGDTFALVAAGGAAILALASLGGAAASAREAPRTQRAAVAGLAVLAYGALGWLALDHAGQLFSFLA